MINNFRKTVDVKELFSLVNTTQLKGICILLVITSHLVNTLNLSNLFYKSFHLTGVFGVTIFLILSGYGLTYSYFKNSDMKHFLQKRIQKVWIPYALVSLIFILIIKYFLGIQLTKFDIILQILGINFARTIDGTMWYITFILIWYLLFYIIYKLKINDFLKLFFIVLFSIFLFSLYNICYTTQYSNIFWQFHIHAFSFVIGVIIGYIFHYKKQIIIVKVNLILISVIYSIIIFSIYITFYNMIDIDDTCLMIFSIMFGFMLLLINMFINSKFLGLIGKYSYEIYLIEYVFMTYFSPMFGDFKNIISILCYYFCILFIGILVSNMSKLIIQVIRNIKQVKG